MVLTRFNVLLEGDRRRALAAVVDLERIEKEQDVAREQKHTLADPGGNARHCDHKLVEERCRSAVRELVGHGREELAECGILRDALGVAAAVDHENAQTGEVALSRMICYVLDNTERRAATADALAILIGNHGKMGLARQKACFLALSDLRFKPLRLLGIRGGEYYIVPAREVVACERAFVIVPCIHVGLGEEKGGMVHFGYYLKTKYVVVYIAHLRFFEPNNSIAITLLFSAIKMNKMHINIHSTHVTNAQRYMFQLISLKISIGFT